MDGSCHGGAMYWYPPLRTGSRHGGALKGYPPDVSNCAGDFGHGGLHYGIAHLCPDTAVSNRDLPTCL